MAHYDDDETRKQEIPSLKLTQKYNEIFFVHPSSSVTLFKYFFFETLGMQQGVMMRLSKLTLSLKM